MSSTVALQNEIPREIKEEKIKCGNIYLMQGDWAILFACNVCELETESLDYFLMHSLEHHMSVERQDIEVLLKQTEGENGIDTESQYDVEELTIKIDRLDEAGEPNDDETPMDSLIEWDEEAYEEDDVPAELAEEQCTAPELPMAERLDTAIEDDIEPDAYTSCPGLFKCRLCRKRIYSRDRYKTHMRRHRGIKPYACEFCDATFVDSSNCNTHRRRHLNIRPHKCDICPKSFISTTELKFHKRAHTGERPHKCDQCERSYKTSSLLKKHKRRHTNERPHVCATCGKQFYDSTHLKEHEVSHTDEKPFECDICGGRFTRRKGLIQHKKLHSGVKQYKCEICEKSFAQGPGLYSHMKTHHRDKPGKGGTEF